METNFGGTTSVASTPSLVEWKNLRFLITDAPKDDNISVYLKLFKKYNAAHIVRISEPLYKKEHVEKAGIQLHEMHFPDGDSPPDKIINEFLDLVTTVFNNPVVVDGVMPCIVVHCVAGLGRAPVLTAIALIEQGLDAMTAVQFIRSKRRGAINSLQLQYLETYEPRGNKGTDNFVKGFVNVGGKHNVNYHHQLHDTKQNINGPEMDPDMALARVQEVTGSVSDQLLKSFNIFSSGLRKSGFKQAVADTLAGEYDGKNVREKLEEEIKSAPCVIFGWSVSPFTKKAVDNFQAIGVRMKVIYLDQPWEEGNPRRAELGKMTGRTSVPFIYIGGEYIGGMDDGPTFEAPGILKLAMQGKLRSMLINAGALDKDYYVDL